MPTKTFKIDDDFAIEQLRRDTGRETQEKTIQDALAFYNFMLKKIKQGEKIFTGMSLASASELVVKQFEAVRAQSAGQRR